MTNISTATPADLRQTLRNMRAENLDASTQLDLIHADVIDAEPITCRHNGGRIDPHHVTTIRAGRLMMRCLAKNAARTAAKLRSASRAPARRVASVSRSYPTFEAGMSTAEYVKSFAALNNSVNPAHVLPYDLSAYRNPCTLYEGGSLDFEPIEQPIDAPELAADALQPVAIVSELTGATMATVPRYVAEQVSGLIASATTAAAIEQASEASTTQATEPDQAPELATVDACGESSGTICDASSASGAPSAPQHGHASSRPHQATHDAHGQRIGQRVAGKSGTWAAVMFTDQSGAPSFEFEGPDGSREVWNFTTGRERMAALQAMARKADQDAQPAAQTDRERRFDAMTATAADVQAMDPEYLAEFLEDLTDCNMHTECLIVRALAAGREDLAARARANLREHLRAGYLTDALRIDRQAISESLRQSTEPDPTHPAGDTPNSDPAGAPGYAPPAPDAHQQTAPVPNLADEVPRAVGADLEPEFTRAAPQPFDMLAMIAAGLAPADLVGLGIVYSGDRANPSGRGAITDVQPCSWYKYTVTVTLEDGRQSRLNPVSFTDHLGNRYRTDFKRHGAPYLAELAAARLAVEAADKAAKQAAADDKARQLRELPQQWPQLKAYDPAGKLNGPTLAAHNIRVLLKEQFPKVKFSVKSDRYSGGDAIDIRWTDGPNTKAVEKIADQFEAGSFNGQEDIYEYAHSVFRDLFGDAKYIHVNRDHSDAAIAQAIEALYLNTEGRPTVEDYRKARGMFDYHENRGAIRRLEQRLDDMGDGFQK